MANAADAPLIDRASWRTAAGTSFSLPLSENALGYSPARQKKRSTAPALPRDTRCRRGCQVRREWR